MAVYFFFQFVLGVAFGKVITGALSDWYAKLAMQAAGKTQVTDAFRAIGLHSSMSVVVPLAILVTGVALWLAARTFDADASKVSAVAAAPA